MKRGLSASLLLIAFAAAPAWGQVCVSPVSPKQGDRGLVLPPPGHPDFGTTPGREYQVQIDQGARNAVSESVGTWIRLDRASGKHTFSAYRNGKRVQSFPFTLASADETQCVVFSALYDTWSLKSVESPGQCGCQVPE